jgi:Protein phosphatase 2C
MPQLSEYIKKVISEKYPSLQMDQLPFEDFLSIIVPFLDGKIIENWDGFYAHVTGTEAVKPSQPVQKPVQQEPPVVVNVPFSSQSSFIGATSEEDYVVEKESIFSPILKLFGKSTKPEPAPVSMPKPQPKPVQQQNTTTTFSALVNSEEKPVTSFSSLVASPEKTPEQTPIFSTLANPEEKPAIPFSPFVAHAEEKPAVPFSPFVALVEEKPAVLFSPFAVPVEEKPPVPFSPFAVSVEEKPAVPFSPFAVPVEEKPPVSFSPFAVSVEEKPAVPFSPFVAPVEEDVLKNVNSEEEDQPVPNQTEHESFVAEIPVEETPITLDSIAHEMEENLQSEPPRFTSLMDLPVENHVETKPKSLDDILANFNHPQPPIPVQETIKELPSDTSNPDWKPDTDKGFSGNGDKYMTFASRRGNKSGQAGNPRKNDYSQSYLSNNQWHILSLASGSETAPYSTKGSQLAVNTTIETLSQHIPTSLDNLINDYVLNNGTKKSVGDTLYNTFGMTAYNAYKSIEDEASEKNTMVNNFATSLIMLIAKKYDFGWFIGTLWVGNGNLGIFDLNSGQVAFLREKGFDLASKIPYITMPEIMQQNELYQRIHFTVIEDFTAIIAMSDGIASAKFGKDETQLSNPTNWKKIWKELQTNIDFTKNEGEVSTQLLKWIGFTSENDDHDRTIGIIY